MRQPSNSNSTLVKTEPGSNRVKLGDSLGKLSHLISDGDAATQTCLQEFQEQHCHYVDQAYLNRTSCAAAVLQWAKESLISESVKLDVDSQMNPEQIEANSDEAASLKLVQVAEDFMLIVKFCREISKASINIFPTEHGIQFEFEYAGRCPSDEMQATEDKGLNIVLSKLANDSSLKTWINCSRDYAELKTIVLKPKARLGFGRID